MGEYYYYDGEDSVGPYSQEGLKHLLEKLRISPDTLIFNEDSDEWVPFSEFKFPEETGKTESVGLKQPAKPRKAVDSGPIWAIRYQQQILLTVSILTMCMVCIASYYLLFTDSPRSYAGEVGPPEPWASNSKYQWPLMVLSNKAWFKGRTELAGASAFLFKHKDGQIYAATARHLLGAAGGVAPGVSLKEFNADLVFWFLAPRSSREKKIQVEGLGQSTKADERNDWLILKLIQDANLSQAIPLRLRPKPVDIDEKVHLVGFPNQKGTPSQNVYTGKVTSRNDDRFRFNIYPTADLTGFNGAPILDDNGLVVGIMTVGFPEAKATKKANTNLCPEAGGQDAVTALDMLAQ